MAYNKKFNPDALPAFAEPERKQPAAPNPTPAAAPVPVPSTQYPPRNSSAQANSPPHYGNKPVPPTPQQQYRDDRLRTNSYGSSGHGTPIPGQNRQQPSPGPVMQPQGNYGYASSPPGSHSGRFSPGQPPRQGSRPNSSSAPTGPTDPSLLPLFRAVDKDGSGQLSETELGAALVNGDWSAFDPHTVRLMIRMFDTDRSGLIGFEEFCGLWSFLASWRTLFDRFDADRSGNISLDEFTKALIAFGYRLSPEFVRYLFGTYDKTNSHSLSFDLFVQSCISLKRMTDSFKKYDDDRDGYVTLSFEDFLTEILRQR